MLARILRIEKEVKRLKDLSLHILPVLSDLGSVVYLVNGKHQITEERASRLLLQSSDVKVYDLNYCLIYSLKDWGWSDEEE
jgi:uncharacterized protein YjiK